MLFGTTVRVQDDLRWSQGHCSTRLMSDRTREMVSRRTLFRQSAVLGGLGLLTAVRGAKPKVPLSEEDDRFLDDLQRAAYLYFWEQGNPQTGLVRDRFSVHGNDGGGVASIAATGFGLTALCIAEKRRYLLHGPVRDRVLATLRALWRKLPNHRGFFYHFADVNIGERQWDSEVSSVDTAILLCGVLTCTQCFDHEELNDLAEDIFNRVDWTWLSEDTTLLPHGWMPEMGFLPYRWDGNSELMMMYLLGLGSSSHPLPAGHGTLGSAPHLNMGAAVPWRTLYSRPPPADSPTAAAPESAGCSASNRGTRSGSQPGTPESPH